ncbi:hypothetical protein GCM10022215_42550 [Nocardioides fonticola]|uniref:Competence protein CoiA nuclease-like domain-containing protein n=1 Tax=Nocardioides fonticola TaxID=450363 RepID=A0ABP7Y322_9ACTN
MSVLLSHAVTDGPNGTAFVILPEDADEARSLRSAYDRRFWCSTQGGGCGHLLDLVAGEVRANHFRHRAGEAHHCDLATEPEAIERSLLHLLLQTILADWLTAQGFDSTLEARLPDAGRADLRVDVHSGANTIEVQISSITVPQWESRDDRYRACVETVTWLFGSQISQALIGEVINRRGVAFKIAHAHDVPLAELGRPEHILVGTTSHSREDWHSLSDCQMTASGLWTPTSAKALAEHDARPPQQEPARLPQPSESSGGRGAMNSKAKLEGRKPPPKRVDIDPPALLPFARRRLMKPPASTSDSPSETRSQGRNPLASFNWFLRLNEWETPTGLLDGLPEELHHPARVLAYMTSQIETSGARTTLAFPDVQDGGLLAHALLNAALIDVYKGPTGVGRWRRRIDT